jgi:hypothetical protein
VGPGAARNTGLKKIDADLYLLTDSDCVVSEDWCLRAVEWQRHRRALMGQGVPWLYQRAANPELGMREENLYRHMFSTYIEGGRTSMIDPRCLMVSREYFARFPRDLFAAWIPDASTQDRAMIGGLLKRGLQVDWCPDVLVYHEDPSDEETLWRQKYRYGRGRIHVWPERPAFEFLLNRYFLSPVAVGNDPDYVVPNHIAFLLGYRDRYRDKNPTSVEWWGRFVDVLNGSVHDARRWLDRVEPIVSIPHDAGRHPAPHGIAGPVDQQLTYRSGSRSLSANIVGIGTIVAEHVIATDGSGLCRYYGSRGGGSVWNILSHLARAGLRTTARGTYAMDEPGTEAVRDLEFLGVATSKLTSIAGKRSLIFTQWFREDMRHGPAIPQEDFSTECPLCRRTPAPAEVPEFMAALFTPDETRDPASLAWISTEA